MSNLFETATRLKYRFQSAIGLLSVEDLWELPLLKAGRQAACLNDVAKVIARTLREAEEESFVAEAGSSQTDLLSDKLELVKHIIQVKKAEQEANEKAEDRRKQKQQLLEILHEKRNDGLKALSIEEIEAKINEMYVEWRQGGRPLCRGTFLGYVWWVSAMKGLFYKESPQALIDRLTTLEDEEKLSWL